MGWKGTLRSLNASVNRMEREQRRRQRELIQQRKLYEKMLAIQQAEFQVQEFENYIDVLLSIHKECGSPWDWNAIVQIPCPDKPIRQRNNETMAEKNLKSFKPSLFDKLFGRTEKKEKVLREAVQIAREYDEKKFEVALEEHEKSIVEWKKTLRIARGIISGDIGSYYEAFQEIDPLNEIDLLGGTVNIKIESSEVIDIELSVNGERVVPAESKSLLKSGKLSVKPMPKTRFYEIYQDYVCGACLRVARELFALLPIKFVIVTAVGELLDTSTGHQRNTPILSVGISRKTLEKLNFDALDPSDSFSHFVHNVKYLKTKGFQEVSKLKIEDFNIE